jgi:hypothetical protein
MTAQEHKVRIAEIHLLLSAMQRNLEFIQQELPGLEMEDDLRDEIVQVCQGFWWTLRDIREELYTLQDKLGLRPGKEPYDPAVTNRDPSGNVRAIQGWLGQDLSRLDRLVKHLWALVEADLGLAAVSVLVTESAANIANAVTKVRQTSNLLLE